MRFARPSEEQEPKPIPAYRQPDWTLTVEEQQPTPEERAAGKLGVQAARETLKAAQRPKPGTTLPIPKSSENEERA